MWMIRAKNASQLPVDPVQPIVRLFRSIRSTSFASLSFVFAEYEHLFSPNQTSRSKWLTGLMVDQLQQVLSMKSIESTGESIGDKTWMSPSSWYRTIYGQQLLKSVFHSLLISVIQQSANQRNLCTTTYSRSTWEGRVVTCMTSIPWLVLWDSYHILMRSSSPSIFGSAWSYVPYLFSLIDGGTFWKEFPFAFAFSHLDIRSIGTPWQWQWQWQWLQRITIGINILAYHMIPTIIHCFKARRRVFYITCMN